MLFDSAPGTIFRPPSEAYSLIIRLTLGCSHNQCTFCSMYKGGTFQRRSLLEIHTLIEGAAKYYPDSKRIFLADGDALCLPTAELLEILATLRKNFSKLQRVTSYTTPQDLLSKSVEELTSLKEVGLQMLYLGLETGSDSLLREIRKGATSAQIIEGCKKVKDAGIKLSVMVILGLGGQEHSEEHAGETAKVASEISPTYLSALSLMLHPGTELRKKAEKGEFTPLSPYEMMDELAEMLTQIKPNSPIIFRASHPSNFAMLSGTLPKNQSRLIQEAKDAQNDLQNYRTPSFNDQGRF